MFFIPGWLISLVTFPGVILHEWAHAYFCNRMGVKVLEVKYFRFGQGVAGYVRHEIPSTYNQTFWISIGPLLVNSLVAVGLSVAATQVLMESWPWYVLGWLAISSGMHSFPSDQDMSHINYASKTAIKEGGNILHYLAFPFVWLVWIANKLRIIWFDLIWAVLLISLGGGFGSLHDITTTKQDKLYSQVEECKVVLNSMSDKIDSEEASLKDMSDQMDSNEKSKDTEKYNSLVEPYNSLRLKIKDEITEYGSKKDSCNNMVDEYNRNL